jgi:hypothetical protein
MELERRVVAPVSTTVALPPKLSDQSQLALTTPFLLALVALVVIVGVPVFAPPTAELHLPSREQLHADNASFHMRILKN